MTTTINLRDFEIPRTAVPLGRGKQIMVRGLSADDLTFLISIHHGPITRALALYQEQRPTIVRTGRLTEFIMVLARDFPDLVAEVISAATDSLDDTTRAVAKKLPFTVQLGALNEIVKLTMEEVGSLKNLLAEMRQRLQEAAASAGAK